MKKICQFLITFLTVGLSLFSCQEIDDEERTIPEVSAPEVTNITETSAKVYNVPYSGYYVLISTSPNMKDAQRRDITTERKTYYSGGKWQEKQVPLVQLTGLAPNTTYYVQKVAYVYCYEKEKVYDSKSPVTEFKTAAFAPTSYTIDISYLPFEGDYGVFTENQNGIVSYERVAGWDYPLYPSSKITDTSTVYVTAPYISGSSDPKAITLSAGDDFYYASGTVNPSSPYLKLDPMRLTAHVTVNINFKATKEEASNLTLQQVAITNVDGDSPLCKSGTLDMTTGKFSASQSGGMRYVNNATTSITSGKTISRTFNGVFPVSFADNAVQVNVSLSGDIENKEVSLPIPSSTWSEGADVNINLDAEYTATGVELYIGNVEVKPWEEGSTGNIDITK